MLAQNTTDTSQVRFGISGRRLHLAQAKLFGGSRRRHTRRPHAREDNSWRAKSPSRCVREGERRTPRSQGARSLSDSLASYESPPRRVEERQCARDRFFPLLTLTAPAASPRSKARTYHPNGFAGTVCCLCNRSSEGPRDIAFGSLTNK